MMRQGSFVYRDQVLRSLSLSFCFIILCVEQSIFISRHFKTKSADKCKYVKGAFCTFDIKKCTLVIRSVIIKYYVSLSILLFLHYIYCTF